MTPLFLTQVLFPTESPSKPLNPKDQDETV